MNLTYAIISIGDILNIDFSQVEESNENTVRISLDGLEFGLKWQSEHEPTFIEDGTIVPLQTLTHKEALALMQTPEWSDPTPPE